MDIRDGFVGSVGNTPLIKLRRASEMTGCTILGKAEFLNPGGSVKDRAAQRLRRPQPGRALALGHREQLGLWRLGHCVKVLCVHRSSTPSVRGLTVQRLFDRSAHDAELL